MNVQKEIHNAFNSNVRPCKGNENVYISPCEMKAMAKKAMAALANEVKLTLEWFVESDIEIYGHIKKGTVEAFAVQGVKFPEVLNELVEK